MKNNSLLVFVVFFLIGSVVGDSIQGSLQIAVPASFLNDIDTQVNPSYFYALNLDFVKVIDGVVDTLVDLPLPEVHYEVNLIFGAKIQVDFTNMTINSVYLDPKQCDITYENGT